LHIASRIGSGLLPAGRLLQGPLLLLLLHSLE
jgi:hypothetical protein